MTMKQIEIERKFLVKTMPDLSQFQQAYILQGYITHCKIQGQVLQCHIFKILPSVSRQGGFVVCEWLRNV